MTSHPDLAGIFAINDPSALGACDAIDRAGKTGRIVVVGFDGQKEGKEAIRDGRIYADPVQYPDRIGINTAKAILDYFEGKDVKPNQPIATSLYRKADAINDPELK
jgi:ribose transport system substrate-binding protein